MPKTRSFEKLLVFTPEDEQRFALIDHINKKLKEWDGRSELYVLLGRSHEISQTLRDRLLIEFRQRDESHKVRIKNLEAKEFWPYYLYDLANEAHIHPTCPDGTFTVMIIKKIRLL